MAALDKSPSAAPLVSVLIVSWNTRELLRECLASLRSHRTAARLEVIVLDNASRDGSAEMVAREFPEAQLIASELNLGFARGNNVAFERAGGEWIWLLNPDTQVLEGALDALLRRFALDKRCGGVASALLDARDGSTQRSCRAFPTPGALWAEATGLARAFPRSKRYGFYRMGWWDMRRARPVEQPMASSFLVPRSVVEECGGLFNESFPIFFNDVDLCRRIVGAGRSIWFEPESRVRHWGGASTRQARAAMILESHRSLERYLRLYPSGGAAVLWATVALVRVTGVARWALARWREAFGKSKKRGPKAS